MNDIVRLSYSHIMEHSGDNEEERGKRKEKKKKVNNRTGGIDWWNSAGDGTDQVIAVAGKRKESRVSVGQT
jgi:hypothetical protein